MVERTVPDCSHTAMAAPLGATAISAYFEAPAPLSIGWDVPQPDWLCAFNAISISGIAMRAIQDLGFAFMALTRLRVGVARTGAGGGRRRVRVVSTRRAFLRLRNPTGMNHN